MNARYAHSPLTRALAGLSLAASIIGSVSTASAVTCTVPFGGVNTVCQQGTSRAVASHTLGFVGGSLKYHLNIDMQGGQVGSYAFGIDVNGNQLNECPTTVTDESPLVGQRVPVSCERLRGQAGPAHSDVFYSYGVNMASTFIVVI